MWSILVYHTQQMRLLFDFHIFRVDKQQHNNIINKKGYTKIR